MAKDTAVGTFAEGFECLLSAISEIESRLKEGDSDSALSLAQAAQLLVRNGIDSPEFIAFFAVEKARLS